MEKVQPNKSSQNDTKIMHEVVGNSRSAAAEMKSTAEFNSSQSGAPTREKEISLANVVKSNVALSKYSFKK